jgi:hypothetical protein
VAQEKGRSAHIAKFIFAWISACRRPPRCFDLPDWNIKVAVSSSESWNGILTERDPTADGN